MKALTTRRTPRHRKSPASRAGIAGNLVPVDSGSSAIASASFIEPDRRRAMISDAAYFLSERRDFQEGHELDDWLAAEREIDRLLGSGPSGNGCGP